ncbi:MAG TPA: ABC transporter permease [Gemmataceae bacterium]|jgi:ABC-type transport system involved in multi-copper enzyme maturation permease subunit
MKFWAILKDSLREALDTKVFYAMAGFSLLVILLVGSVGYRPVSVEEEARNLTEQMTWIIQRFGARHNLDSPPRWDIQDFEQTQPGARPWETGYRFALTVTFADDQQAEQARKVQQGTRAEIQRLLRQRLSYLKQLEVAEEKPRDPKEMRYQVSAEGGTTSRIQDWPHQVVLFFVVPIRLWSYPIVTYVHFWESTIINWLGAAVALLISTIVTAFFIPNMLRKGTVDLLIVKPISRSALLFYKYVGGMTFMFLNTVVVVVGIWLVLGLRTNLWGTGFLFSIAVLTFQFAMYYAVSTLFAVLTRSSIVAILMTCLAWFLFAFVIGYGYQGVDMTRKVRDIVMDMQEEMGEDNKAVEQMPAKLLPDWVYTTADIIHFVTPHLKDLDVLTDKWILDDVYPPENPQRKIADKVYANFHWTEAVAVTFLYILVLLGLSCWRFATRDY